MAAHRKPEPGSKYFRDLEAATTDIQLFGTESQIREVSAFLQQWKAQGRGDLDDLLSDLRNDLRKELGQPQYSVMCSGFVPKVRRSRRVLVRLVGLEAVHADVALRNEQMLSNAAECNKFE